MCLSGEVEEHRTTVTNSLNGRWPLSVGEAADAVAISDLHEGDGGALLVAS